MKALADLKWEAHYRIVGFGPSHHGMGLWGFSIEFDTELAKQLVQRSINEDQYKRIQEDGIRRIKEIRKNQGSDVDMSMHPPFQFWEDTCLVTNLTVPGNACGLDMSSNDFSRVRDREKFSKLDRLSYGPHNVDSMTQACELLSLFTLWHERCEYLHEEYRLKDTP